MSVAKQVELITDECEKYRKHFIFRYNENANKMENEKYDKLMKVKL